MCCFYCRGGKQVGKEVKTFTDMGTVVSGIVFGPPAPKPSPVTGPLLRAVTLGMAGKKK